jgi:hypothetical protein
MARIRRSLMNLLHQAFSGRVSVGVGAFERLASSALDRAETLYLWPPAAREAHARGIQLLKEHLSPAQRDQYMRYGHFEVTGGETGRRYRIRTGFQANVEEVDRMGRVVRLLCFMPKGELVVGDVMLAQKMALELFESDALRVANSFSSHAFPLGPMP